jgi:hypothetical protein
LVGVTHVTVGGVVSPDEDALLFTAAVTEFDAVAPRDHVAVTRKVCDPLERVVVSR